jgi:hypothetical protein
VELFELAQGVEQVLPVPNHGRSNCSRRQVWIHPFHDRVYSWRPDAAQHDVDARVCEDGVEQIGNLAVPVGHAFMQRLRGGHHELAIDTAPATRVAAAFTELAQTI